MRVKEIKVAYLSDLVSFSVPGHCRRSTSALLLVDKRISACTHPSASAHDLRDLLLIHTKSAPCCLRERGVPRIALPIAHALQVERGRHLVDVLPCLFVGRWKRDGRGAADIGDEPADLLHQSDHVDDTIRDDSDGWVKPCGCEHCLAAFLTPLLLRHRIGRVLETSLLARFFVLRLGLAIFLPYSLKIRRKILAFVFSAFCKKR